MGPSQPLLSSPPLPPDPRPSRPPSDHPPSLVLEVLLVVLLDLLVPLLLRSPAVLDLLPHPSDPPSPLASTASLLLCKRLKLPCFCWIQHLLCCLISCLRCNCHRRNLHLFRWWCSSNRHGRYGWSCRSRRPRPINQPTNLISPCAYDRFP